MNVTVIAAHPSVVILKGDQGQFELPRDAFPTEPSVGQVWTINLEHEPTEEEKLDDLNSLLPGSAK